MFGRVVRNSICLTVAVLFVASCLIAADPFYLRRSIADVLGEEGLPQA